MPPTYAHREFERQPVLLWPKDLVNGEVIPPPAGGHNPLIPVGGRTYYLPMETCDTLAHHWFWEAGDALKSVRSLIRTYHATVDKGANILLDLAPDKTGRIPEATAARLMEMKAALADPTLVRPSLTSGAKATASNIYKNDPEYAPAKAVDDDSGTRWATDEGTGECWLEVDLGAEREFDGAFLSEGWDRVREYALEVKGSASRWKPIAGDDHRRRGSDPRLCPDDRALCPTPCPQGRGRPDVLGFRAVRDGQGPSSVIADVPEDRPHPSERLGRHSSPRGREPHGCGSQGQSSHT
jgi:hypothetical protein